MLIKRQEISPILTLINSLGNQKFDISTQYKLIKIRKYLEPELEIYQQQIQDNCSQFFELDSSGNPIINEQGGYKIQQDKITDCYKLMREINAVEVQIPDTYLSLDELKDINLTLNELGLLEVFVRN